MEQSQPPVKLLAALIKAKETFKSIGKDRINPHYKSKYATLSAVMEAIEPSLLQNGLVFVHTIAENRLVTRLHHTSGEFLESVFPLPEIADPQKVGSAITYAKRYSVCAIASVTADEDDDGNAAKPGRLPSVAVQKVKQARERAGMSTEDCKKLLALYDGADHPDRLNEAQLAQLLEQIHQYQYANANPATA